jgi:ribonucleoside-diphosphate reductase alpha chain
VLTVFVDKAKNKPGFENAIRSVESMRAIGIGVMGWHSLLQSKMIPFESPMAKGLNQQIFKAIREASDKHQIDVIEEHQDNKCELSAHLIAHGKLEGYGKRNVHTMAVAPTMSISNLCNLTSSGIEPQVSNAYSKKLLQGTFSIKNKYLDEVISDKAMNVFSNNPEEVLSSNSWREEQWSSIIKHGGSVQHLDWMDDYTKEVFKTAFEIDQRAVISQAGDRAKYIDQSQSVNIFLPAECSYEELHAIHFMAWEVGNKSLYYLRSEPESKADTTNRERKAITLEDSVCVACE